MKRFIAAMLVGTAAIASSAWAQTTTEPTANTAQAAGNTDEIVHMRAQIAAANAEYNKKVAAAKKVFDSKKAAAAKVRDEKVAAAHNGVPGQ